MMNLSGAIELFRSSFFQKKYIYYRSQLVDVSDCVSSGSYEIDVVKVNYEVAKVLRNIRSFLIKNFKLDYDFKLPLNSLYRPVFSVLGKEIDYKDVYDSFGHWTGFAIDVSFPVFCGRTGRSEYLFRQILLDNGFEQPFRDEVWHFRYKK